MSQSVLLLLAALGLALTGLFDGFETGLYSVNRVRLRLQLELKSFGSRSLSHLLRDLPGAITTILIGTNVATYLCVACVTELCREAGIRLVSEEFAATLILTPIIFVFAEMTPKDLFRVHTDHWTYLISPLMRGVHWLLYPFTALFRAAARLVSGAAEAAPEVPIVSRLGLQALISEGQEEGVLTSYQTAIAANITHLQTKRLRDVMVPIDQAVAVSVFAPVEEVEALAIQHQHSRFPVYRGERHQIIGIVNVLDHLFAEERKSLVTELLRPAPSLGEGDNVHASLVHLRRERMPMGIVRDSHGRATGIVTIKDLVEEIVGELEAF